MAVAKQNRDPLTLEQIRAALPTHIMLTPGVHRWRDGDEFVSGAEWEPICGPLGVVGNDIKPFQLARRPIHPHILDNQAFWLLLDKGFEAPDHFADKAENLGIVKKLGGLDNYRKQRKLGRLYDKWLLEQMEDV